MATKFEGARRKDGVWVSRCGNIRAWYNAGLWRVRSPWYDEACTGPQAEVLWECAATALRLCAVAGVEIGLVRVSRQSTCMTIRADVVDEMWFRFQRSCESHGIFARRSDVVFNPDEGTYTTILGGTHKTPQDAVWALKERTLR